MTGFNGRQWFNMVSPPESASPWPGQATDALEKARAQARVANSQFDRANGGRAARDARGQATDAMSAHPSDFPNTAAQQNELNQARVQNTPAQAAVNIPYPSWPELKAANDELKKRNAELREEAKVHGEKVRALDSLCVIKNTAIRMLASDRDSARKEAIKLLDRNSLLTAALANCPTRDNDYLRTKVEALTASLAAKDAELKTCIADSERYFRQCVDQRETIDRAQSRMVELEEREDSALKIIEALVKSRLT